MKNNIFIFAVSIAAVIFIMSDDSLGQSLTKIGLKIGVTGSTLIPGEVMFIASGNFVEFGNFQYKPGTIVGVFMRYNFYKYFSIQPEINYIFKGAKVQRISGEFDNGSLDLNFVEIPLLLNFCLSPESLTSMIFFGGPSVSFLQNGEIYRDVERYDKFDVSELFEKRDVGLLLGIGLKRNLVTIDFRYYRGYIAYDKTLQNNKTYNRTFTISVNFVIM